ncbi:MAG: hypothetical protein SOZ79_00710, partial [Candidatus Ventricola sp.]|nr:hypothetical protein [Candidatus Ventricola sp.]
PGFVPKNTLPVSGMRPEPNDMCIITYCRKKFNRQRQPRPYQMISLLAKQQILGYNMVGKMCS